MKKLCLVFMFCLLASLATTHKAYSADYDSWLTAGYAYNFPGKSDYKSIGPINVAIGTSFFNLLGIELSVAYSNYKAKDVPYFDFISGGLSKRNMEAHSVWLRPYVLIRPQITLGSFALIPYVGVGASANIVVQTGGSSGNYSTKFDGGLAAKAGIGFGIKMFTANVEAEYLLLSKYTDLGSNYSLGVNVGIRF